MSVYYFRSESNFLLAKVKITNNVVSVEVKCRKCKTINGYTIISDKEIRCSNCNHLLAKSRANSDFVELQIKCRVTKALNTLLFNPQLKAT